MSLNAVLNRPFYTGGASSNLVPGVFPVALGGRPYMLDLDAFGKGMWKHETIPLVRSPTILQSQSQADEGSLNPEDFWRRSVTSWDHGAGQDHLDLAQSDQSRFRASFGVDPWTRGEIHLLHDTEQKYVSAGKVFIVPVGDFFYVIDGNTVKYTSDPSVASPSFTTVTAVAASLSTPTSVTTDGYHLWIADATNTYVTVRGTGTYIAYPLTAQGASVIRFVKGRLIGAGPGTSANVLFEYAAQGSDVTVFSTILNVNFAWKDFTAGPQGIYGIGVSGDKSSIYFVTVDDVTTALAAPRVTSDLPAGESVRAIEGYLDFLVIGTDHGLRFAATSAQGSIQLGDLIALPSVLCFEPHDRFVWFGWTNQSSALTGLGRLDLRTLNGTTPAYASDLLARTTGAVSAVETFHDKRYFVVDGAGIYGETAGYVSTAQVDSGLISYGLPDQKVATYLTTQTLGGAGSYQPSLALGATNVFSTVGQKVVTQNSSTSTQVSVGQKTSEYFEVRYGLFRATDPNVTPVLSRWTLRADPHAPRRVQITVPLRLDPTEVNLDEGEYHYVPRAERQQIRAWAESRQVIPYQEGDDAYSVIVEDYQWNPYKPLGSPTYDHSGTMVVLLRTV